MKNEENWLIYYNLVETYYETYGDIDIPQDFKTLDGITYNKKGFFIRSWVDRQRKKAMEGKLTKQKIKKFYKFGAYLRLSKQDEIWVKKFKLALNYYKRYKDLNIPRYFCTKDGITFDEEGVKLGVWLHSQQLLFDDGKLDEKKIKLFTKIGYDFSLKARDRQWLEMYNLAKKYKEINGNLNIPFTFDESKKKYDYNGLDQWLYEQRLYFRKGILRVDRYLMLSELGLVWIKKTEDIKLYELCNIYNINYDINKEVIDSLNHYELNAKINYLLTNNLPLHVNGRLHEIFSMCSANMEQKYGITYENVILGYYKKDMLLELKEAS